MSTNIFTFTLTGGLLLQNAKAWDSWVERDKRDNLLLA